MDSTMSSDIELTRASILALDDSRKPVPVNIPEWGGVVYIKHMSADERDRFEADHTRCKDAHVRARLVVYTACDSAGNLLFTHKDLLALGSKSCGAVQRLFNVAIKFNKISASDIDELEKN